MSTIESLHKAQTLVESRCAIRPTVAIVLGSGLGAFADRLENATRIPYRDIPGFPVPSAEGHAGELILGEISGIPVACMLVLISDHINLQGTNPLIGANIDELGMRFPDMTEAYPERLRVIAKEVAANVGVRLHEGVYMALLGPSFETPAEIRAFRTMGADLVGMSTVPEVIAANHMGIACLGISCVTNVAAGLSDEKLSHEDVLETGRAVQAKFESLLEALLPRLG